MKAAVLHEYDEPLNKPIWVNYEEIPNPKIEKKHRCDRAHRRGGSVPNRPARGGGPLAR